MMDFDRTFERAVDTINARRYELNKNFNDPSDQHFANQQFIIFSDILSLIAELKDYIDENKDTSNQKRTRYIQCDLTNDELDLVLYHLTRNFEFEAKDVTEEIEDDFDDE